uniref:CCHC-type domain-containing protein n=1 Tax=Fagus sylvatica TaxID=28930 RepID=A0A2N9EJ37_FAGSY
MASSSSSSSFSSPANSGSPTLTSIQTPMILLSNISNLVSVKLDQSNYVQWKYQITSILKAYNILGFTTVLGVWSILEKRYTSASRSNILNLKMELHNIKKESTNSVNSFLQKVKDTRDRLAAVGVQIDNEEILHIVLKGLPHEYHAFSTAIRTQNDATSFEDIHVLLMTEEKSLKNSNDLSKEHAHMAMVANANKNATLFSSQNNRGCGRNGFNRGKGRNFNNNSSRGGYNNSGGGYNNSGGNSGGNSNNFGGFNTTNQRLYCQICGKTGHVALDCYHCMDYAYQEKQPPSKLVAMAATSNAQHPDQSY